jgi:hypothetical protein
VTAPAGRRSLRLAAACALALGAASAGVQAQAAPRLPSRTIDLREQTSAGRTIAVGPGGSLQDAIDAAEPGDTLALDPRGVFGPVVLPRKQGAGWITIRSSAELPPAGTRVGPADAALMPKLVAEGAPAISAEPGAHHYRLIGLEVLPPAGAFRFALIELGESTMATAELPHDLVVARCYLHGDPAVGGRRGIALNSGAAAVVDSYLSDFKEAGADSQAIAGWSGPGPFLISNSYLEAAGENLLFGGADPPSADRIPSDIEVRGNHLAKPLAWQAGASGKAHPNWTVKNLFELKDARRVLIQGNVFEHNWAQAQNGFAILFTVRNQDGTAPWSVVEDVTFAGNLVRDTGAGINILGHDDSHPGGSAQTQRIAIRDNRFENLGGASWGGNGTLFQLLERTSDVVIEHNTGFQSGSVLMAEGAPHRGFVFRDNVVLHNLYGIIGTGTGSGASTLTTYFPDAVVKGNVFIGGDAARYPSGNRFAASIDTVFADPEHRSLRAPYADAGARSAPGLPLTAARP